MTQTAELLIGPSGSGKTTIAKQRNNVVIVCRDDIRTTILSERLGRTINPGELWKLWKFDLSENEVTKRYLNQCVIAFSQGKNIVCADTNLSAKTRNKLTKELTSIGFSVFETTLFVSKVTCIYRDSLRPEKVGKKVIESQYETYLEHLKATGQEDKLALQFMVDMGVKVSTTGLNSDFDKIVEKDLRSKNPVGEREIYEYFTLINKHLKVEQDMTLNSCVLIDLDGTAYNMVNRTAFEWMKVDQDEPIEALFLIAEMYHRRGVNVIFFSGRDSVCRELTDSTIKRDMKRFHVDFEYKLFMRAMNDYRSDDFVKLELYNSHIRGNYFVDVVFDDRPRVLRLWQYLGFKTMALGLLYKHF